MSIQKVSVILMFPMFSPRNLGQIELPMKVSASAHHEDSESPPTCFSWWSFGWDIQGQRQLRVYQNLTSHQLFTDSLEMELCLQPWITESIIKFKDQGQFWNLLVMRILNFLWFLELIELLIKSSESVKSWREVEFWNALNCLAWRGFFWILTMRNSSETVIGS